MTSLNTPLMIAATSWIALPTLHLLEKAPDLLTYHKSLFRGRRAISKCDGEILEGVEMLKTEEG